MRAPLFHHGDTEGTEKDRKASTADTLQAGGRYAFAPDVLLGGSLRTRGLHLISQPTTGEKNLFKKARHRTVPDK